MHDMIMIHHPPQASRAGRDPDWTTVYDTVYVSHPTGTVFQARLLDNQEGANTERYAFGKLSARCFHAELFGTDTIPTSEISTMENQPRAV